MGRHFFLLRALCALVVLGCGPIPDDPLSSGEDVGDLVYVNEPWGFQLTRPSEFWGISAQTFPLVRDANNGRPYVDVRISSPYIDFSSNTFRPELRLEPRGMTNGTRLDAMVGDFERELQALFAGYQAVGDQQRHVLNDGEVVMWEFRNGLGTPNRQYPGTQFLAAVALHNRDGYFFIANGNAEGFPVADYRSIVSSLRFLR